MMFWITTLLSLIILIADCLVYRYRVRLHHSIAIRRLFIGFTLTTALLPLLVIVLFSLKQDNTTEVMAFAQWCFFIYMITVLPRMTYYLFAALRLPRVGIAAAAGIAGLFIWGATAGRTSILVNRVMIHAEGLPVAFEGFRVVQFSDTHIGTMIHPERELQRLVDTINTLHPDLIVFSGDLVNVRYTELNTTIMRILGSLRASYGVVSSTGNHDVGYYIKDSLSLPSEENLARLLERQRAMGWRVLDNTTEYIVRGNDSISVSGVSFDRSLRDFRHSFDLPDIDLSKVYIGASDSLYNITVSHLPQLWPNIMELGYGNLTLAGHVHSMQMQVRLGKSRFSPAQWMYDRWSGLYTDPRGYLYINDGIGYVGFPMRLGAYPEVTLFTLER